MVTMLRMWFVWIVTSTYIGTFRSLSIPVASLPAVPRSVPGASSAGLACLGLASRAAYQGGPGSPTPWGSH